jgi:hypothetical protein
VPIVRSGGRRGGIIKVLRRGCGDRPLGQWRSVQARRIAVGRSRPQPLLGQLEYVADCGRNALPAVEGVLRPAFAWRAWVFERPTLELELGVRAPLPAIEDVGDGGAAFDHSHQQLEILGIANKERLHAPDAGLQALATTRTSRPSL